MKKCVIVLDVDGTIVPINIDFDSLRARIREILGINHPLRPLGESLASLPISEELKERAWSMIEEAELESVRNLNITEVASNIEALKTLRSMPVDVYLVTMRSKKTLEPLLEKLGLSEYLEKSVTRDLHPSRRLQLEYIKTLTNATTIVFIGDTIYDENAAREAGILFYRVSSYRELPQVLNNAIKKCTGG